MEEVLSQWIVVGDYCGRVSSAANWQSQRTFDVAADKDLYSASVEDFAMVTCFLTDHQIRFGSKNVQNPEIDFMLVASNAQLASVYEWSSRSPVLWADQRIEFL